MSKLKKQKKYYLILKTIEDIKVKIPFGVYIKNVSYEQKCENINVLFKINLSNNSTLELYLTKKSANKIIEILKEI